LQHTGLVNALNTNGTITSLTGWVLRRENPLVYGLSGSQSAMWLAGLLSHTGHSMVVVTAGPEEARRLVADLSAFLPEGEVAYFPPAEVLPFDVLASSTDLAAQRLAVMEGVLQGRIRALAVPAVALVQDLLPPGVWRQTEVSLAVGDTVVWEDLLARLDQLGYQRAEVVETPGQLAVRGGIIDLFPLTAPYPYRVEFFDDEVDSIRDFDPATQRSGGKHRQVTIPPAREVVLTPTARQQGCQLLQQEYQHVVKRLARRGQAEAVHRLQDRVGETLEQLQNGRWGEGMFHCLRLFYPDGSTILQYFNRPPVVVLDEPGRIKEAMAQYVRQTGEAFTQMLESGAALPAQAAGLKEFPALLQMIHNYPTLSFTLLPREIPGLQPGRVISITAKAMHSFLGNMSLLAEEIRAWRQGKSAVVVFAATQERAEALRHMLWDEKVEATVAADVTEPPQPGQVVIAVGSLSRGLELPQWKLVVVGDGEVFTQKRKPRPRKAFKEGTRLAVFTDLNVGDYVVHVQHGIGRYKGIEQLDVGGVKRDYLLVQYAGEDKLYVPTDQVDLIQKYVGAEGHVPKLHRLGGNEWNRVKGRVKESVKAMAEDLLALYAAREAMPGHAFAPDTIWQQEFEATFPYTETPDQLRAIREVKADMERPRPMDRLLCGDVGYGKTEVALRAAFKAVMDGKQVAVLVPTTILAQQHYHTFRERMASFPVTVDVLSRFRSAREQDQVIEGIQKGTVDVVIGTHRLLSSDVVFKNLGLVVVDEEQRFGVGHKERLKTITKNVDVLTLTATPIPRTLHMGLIGVRDMSIIETPPEERFPVQTYVVEYSPELVSEAIRRELARGGQVYYLHNRVMDLDQTARRLQEILPDARIAIAHGQMREDDLEQVMLEFVEGYRDVLVCTAIVENGLDIGNVNTLIVDDADRLGLSQLYQLRGRVGRTNRLAYAYFTYRRDKVLTPEAEKRLAAIREFTQLGSGFKIAMRDLEIRGAGNILGPEQHGHMMAVGFDLYCRLLEEAVQELKTARGEVPPPVPPAGPVVEVGVDAFLSDGYIRHPGLKMEVYQRLMNASAVQEVEELAEEMVDRFGDLPPAAQNLVTLAGVKALARETRVIRVEQGRGEVTLVFGPDHRLKGEKLMELAAAFPRRLSFKAAGGLAVGVKVAGLSQKELLALLESVLKRVKVLATPSDGLV